MRSIKGSTAELSSAIHSPRGFSMMRPAPGWTKRPPIRRCGHGGRSSPPVAGFPRIRWRPARRPRVRQVVVLGAGLDTFSLRNPHAGQGVRVFEVDYPATQGWERERLKQAGLAVPASCSPSHLSISSGKAWTKGRRFSGGSPRVFQVARRGAVSDPRGGFADAGFHRSGPGIGSGVRLRRAV